MMVFAALVILVLLGVICGSAFTPHLLAHSDVGAASPASELASSAWRCQRRPP